MSLKSRLFSHLRPSFPVILCALLLGSGVAAFAQPAAPATAPAAPAQAAQPAPNPAPSSIVQPALSNVQRSLMDINVERWKAPNEVRSATEQNSNSIQNDLNNTLPGLLTQADAAPNSVPPCFALYRNLDALYDVLLRVYETALLAAPSNEVDELSQSLQHVEAARTQLAESILHSSQQQESEVAKLQAAVKAAAVSAAQTAPAKTTVVDDGPTPAPAHKRRKPAKPAPATQPAAAPSTP